MSEIEIGRGKRGRRAYSFEDIAVVPSRRTRDPEEVSIAWQIDAYHFELPVIAAPMDSVVSPETAIAVGRLGGLGVLKTYAAPVSNDVVPVTFTQKIAATDALRTGAYSKTLTFTLSTTQP